MAPSCPVDRRPFTNVYRWDGNLSCVQVSLIVEDIMACLSGGGHLLLLFIIQHSEFHEALF